MGLLTWFDFSFFLLLLALFIYVFVYNAITMLHKIYLFFHFLMMIWPLGQFSVHITSNPHYQLVYLSIAFVGLSLVGFGWLLYTKYLINEAYAPNRTSLLYMSLPGLTTAALVIWNPGGAFMVGLGGQYNNRIYGPLFWLLIVVLAGYVIHSFWLLWNAYRSERLVQKRPQIADALTGMLALTGFALLDLLLNVVLAAWLPVIPGLTSLGLVISVIFFVFSLRKHRIFEVESIAQRDVLDSIAAGVIVLDSRDTVIEMNRQVHPAFGIAVGFKLHIEELLAYAPNEAEKAVFTEAYKRRQSAPASIELVFPVGGANISVLLHCSPLTVRYAQPSRVLTFHIITEFRRQLSEMKSNGKAMQQKYRELIHVQDELFQANRRLELMAITDSLTGCFNRGYLMLQLEREVLTNSRYQVPFAILLFDIDLFKSVNDTYGHLVGDEVICRTADHVRGILRRTDLLARYGGEEFAVYLPHTNKEQAEVLAQRIRKKVESNVIVTDEGHRIAVTISMGVLGIEQFPIAELDDPKAFLRQMFAKADSALYSAKENGRNQVVPI